LPGLALRRPGNDGFEEDAFTSCIPSLSARTARTWPGATRTCRACGRRWPTASRPSMRDGCWGRSRRP